MGSWGIVRSIRIQFPEMKILDLFPKELSRKHLPLMFSLIKNGGDQRRSGTVVVFTISHANLRLVSLAL